MYEIKTPNAQPNSKTNDKTVPNAPSNLTQVAGTYTDGNGVSKAFIKLSWTQPTNSDGSTIIDGSIYRIRFKAKADSLSNNITDSVISCYGNKE